MGFVRAVLDAVARQSEVGRASTGAVAVVVDEVLRVTWS